jgi:hypothetical protein
LNGFEFATGFLVVMTGFVVVIGAAKATVNTAAKRITHIFFRKEQNI